MEDRGPTTADLDFEKLPEPGDRFKLSTKLGSGVSGKVYEATDNQTGRKVAVKVLNLTRENENEIKEEYRILRDLSNNDNLPDFYGIYLKKGRADIEQVWFVMELCQGGTAIDFVKGLQDQAKKVNEQHIAYILRETIKAVIHLHENHVIHRDIRGSNILLTDDGRIKLVDYGICRRLNRTSEKIKTCIGSPSWLPPEVVTCGNKDQLGGYDARADVWALGITAIELGNGKAPFENMHPARALFQIVRNPPPTLYRPSHWSQLYNDFVTECLEKNPENRPYMQELLEHPFVASLDTDKIVPEIQSTLETSPSKGSSKKPDVQLKKGFLKVEQQPFPEKIHQEDLAALENVTEDAILTELHERLKKKQVHTFIGDVLLILNPNEKLDIYDDKYHGRYQFKARSDNAPHIYSVADSAYQDVLHHEEPQHIVFAGETASGKTTNMMHIFDHLIYLGQGNKCCEKIPKALRVIQALGNAGTTHNPNSTRHVLQTQITFTDTGKISGAIFWVYQLEKTRVTSTERNQPNFHLFYYFYDAMESEGALPQYNLEGGRDYRYLKTGTGSPVVKPSARENPRDNVRKFLKLEQDLKDLGFTDDQLTTVKNILSAILLLGETKFRDGEDGNAAIENPDVVITVAKLLGLDEKKLSWSLVNYCVILKGEASRRRHLKAEATEARDVLARGLYFRLVDWIVNTINDQFSIPRAIYGDRHYISVMDLFGFECFNKNTLEQLFVNAINEQMQFHYNQRVFAWEMQHAEEEDIPVPDLQYYDNKPAVDQLMSKPDGLLYLLDEGSRRNEASYLTATLKSGKTSHISVINSKEFSVAHYTGKVTYDASGMPDKNRDFLPPEMIETMRQSSYDVVKQLFTGLLTKTGNLTIPSNGKLGWKEALVAEKENRRNRKFNTESRGQYSQSRQMRTAASTYRSTCLEILKSLTVSGCGVHFVRCIRTDLMDKPGGFQSEVVRQQLRALAVIDTVRARQQGYSYRVPLGEFIRRYKFLAFDFDENVELTKENCRLLLLRLKMEGWAIGKTRIFLKYYNEEYLSRLYETQVKKIVKVQAMMRAFIAKRTLLAKIKNYQEKVEKIPEKPKEETKKPEMTEEEAAKIIQKKYRGHSTRKELAPLISSSEKLDEESTVFIRRWYKKWKAKSIFQVLLLYRAAQHQTLVYFCQQAHLFNINFLSNLQDNNTPIDLKDVDPKAQPSTYLPPYKPSVYKLPFRLRDVPYIDSKNICDPIQGYRLNSSAKLDDEEEWDFPLQKHEPLPKEKTSVLDKGCQTTLRKSHNTLHDTPFVRDPSKPVVLVSKFDKSCQIKQDNAVVKDIKHKTWKDDLKKVEPRFKFQTNGPYKPPAIVVSSNDYTRDNSPYRAPLSVKKSQNVNNPIKELEEKYRRKNIPEDSDEPPFNFQAMLKKTNHSRASFKRKSENVVYNSENLNGNVKPPSNKKSLKKTKAPPPPKQDAAIELAPGIIIRGEIADL